MSNEHICFEPIQFASATEKGLKDVSIMTKGEANGHGMIVDDTTLDQFMKLSLGKTIPAYLTHEGAIDENGRAADRLGKEIGMFSGFYRDGEKIRARNFQFLEAFKASEPKAYATILEMAKTYADKLGISPVLRHMKAWVTGNGDVPAKDGVVPAGALNKFPSMRLSELLSCDFVQQPATNMGLFSALVDPATNNEPPTQSIMSAETILLAKHNEALTAKDGEIKTLSAQHKDAITALEAKHGTEISILQKKADDAVAALAVAQENGKSLTSALAAKTQEAEDAAKYDMRKAGAPALEVALQARSTALPAPAATDSARWEQWASLATPQTNDRGQVIGHAETPASAAFRAKYLSRK